MNKELFDKGLKVRLNNGLTKKEIGEAFLQVAVYVGMPAGLGCFKVAKQVFKEMGI